MSRPFLLSLVLAAGCGAPTPAEQCRRVVSVTCKKLFECAQAQAATLYGDEANCRTVQEEKLQCTRAQASCDIDPGKFDKCLADTAAASCTVTSQPASCASSEVCRTGGGLFCSGVSSSVNNNTCTFTLRSCSDGNTYAVRCTNASCACLLNGNESKTFTSSADFCGDSSAAKPLLNSSCGWSVR